MTAAPETVTEALAEIKHNAADYHGKILGHDGATARIAFPTAYQAFGWAGDYNLQDSARFETPISAMTEKTVLLASIQAYIDADGL